MALPRTHSFQWSDQKDAKDSKPGTDELAQRSPVTLKNKELLMWVVYPNAQQAHKRGGRRKSCRKDLKLWAVIIIDDLKQICDFTYEVKLKRVFKQGERSITVWVRNDPRDQSNDAEVFGFISPNPRLLTPLENHLANLAAKRVYDLIVDTWGETANQ